MFSKTYFYMRRYRQIISVLLRYGFEDLVTHLRFDQFFPGGWHLLTTKRVRKVTSLSRAARIRMVLEELGPTFIKMGQILSTRYDLIPRDILDEFAKLQDAVPSFPSEQAKEILNRELKKPYFEVFAEFEDEPLAAGSIGQVHRARLLDGTEVAVKIQRPGIRKIIDVDLEIIRHMAGLFERHVEDMRVHRPTDVVEEFSRTLHQELDYKMEAANIERFARQFRNNEDIFVHKVFRKATTSRVICTEMVKGVKPDPRERLVDAGLDPVVVAHKGARLIMTQVFIYGFFHADPHPGNIMVLPGDVLSYLDFGMMGRLTRQSREQLAELLMSMVSEDVPRVTEAILRITNSHNLINRTDLERDVSVLMDQHLYRPLEELEVGHLLEQVFELTVRYDLRIPPNLFLLTKAISQVEGLGRNLDPVFDIIEQAKPYIVRLKMDRFRVSRMLRDFYESSSELFYLIKESPGEIRDLFKQIKQGRIKIEFEHVGLGPLTKALERVSNRISSAIVLGSLIIGSSLIVNSGLPPKWNGIPVVGLTGFVLSGLMAVSMLISIWRGRGN